jgi:hypothetical protein
MVGISRHRITVLGIPRTASELLPLGPMARLHRRVRGLHTSDETVPLRRRPGKPRMLGAVTELAQLIDTSHDGSRPPSTPSENRVRFATGPHRIGCEGQIRAKSVPALTSREK